VQVPVRVEKYVNSGALSALLGNRWMVAFRVPNVWTRVDGVEVKIDYDIP